jgi:hypothetical protein
MPAFFMLSVRDNPNPSRQGFNVLSAFNGKPLAADSPNLKIGEHVENIRFITE